MSDIEKPRYPTKACPHCGELIHARSKKHLACGWVMDEIRPLTPHHEDLPKSHKPVVNGQRFGEGGLTLEEIQEVKKVVDKIGAQKVQQLARVLGK